MKYTSDLYSSAVSLIYSRHVTLCSGMTLIYDNNLIILFLFLGGGYQFRRNLREGRQISYFCPIGRMLCTFLHISGRLRMFLGPSISLAKFSVTWMIRISKKQSLLLHSCWFCSSKYNKINEVLNDLLKAPSPFPPPQTKTHTLTQWSCF